VRPEDFRASIERVVRLSGDVVPPFFSGVTGASACSRRRCDLAKGIETDAAARTITIHLRRPDAEFLHKLAIPLAYVLPARTPAELITKVPAPGTGPYAVAAFDYKRGVRLVRNRRFASWSAEARPDGFADAITVNYSADPEAQVQAVLHGRADATLIAGENAGQLSVPEVRALALADPSHTYTAPAPTTTYIFLNTRERPFDDPRVRRALNYAIDRRHILALAGGSDLVALTCQLIPPGMPGYRPTCPSSLAPSPAGSWFARDLARARRLVAASGTRGARVTLWGFAGARYLPVVRYTGAVLRRLGYRVQVRVQPDGERFFAYVNDSRHHVQAGLTGWIDDFLTASSFFEQLRCDAFVPHSQDNLNLSHFCDPTLDASYDAALRTTGTEANARWAALDRRASAAAPLVPLFNRRSVMLLSDRVGNAQMDAQVGPLLDQFWVR
jgi:peptide/nickel transport system substrate-binding protein